MTETDKAGYESYKITIGSKSFEPTSAERISSINVSYKANKIPYAVINFIDGDPSKETFILSSSKDIKSHFLILFRMVIFLESVKNTIFLMEIGIPNYLKHLILQVLRKLRVLHQI